MSDLPTVTVFTADHGDVTMPEPSWCTGEHSAEGYRADIEHQGEEIELTVQTPCHGPVAVAKAGLLQRPFSELGPKAPLVMVEFDELHEYDAESLAGLLDALVAWAIGPMHQLHERLQLLEGGDQ
ncbi:DUF6907 domain-containing protein [Streptomyces africanus]|uniref:DUF6907 domain-containing protein n=1 Tax=Streptomyces africanus TaxID=231024 RepID=UPI000A3B05DE|nr:hypothetical protein [Streptomyces africanus]